jgi:4-hydroxybenzoate polyprenyltransferase
MKVDTHHPKATTEVTEHSLVLVAVVVVVVLVLMAVMLSPQLAVLAATVLLTQFQELQ